MAKVTVEFLDENSITTKVEEVLTTGDTVYIFDDIANHLHARGEFSKVPKGTKEIRVSIPCDF